MSDCDSGGDYLLLTSHCCVIMLRSALPSGVSTVYLEIFDEVCIFSYQC